MSSELKISKEGLKDIAVTLDSYRIRVLVDAKQEILDSGIYNEEQYDQMLFKMFDEELLKYKLFNYLSNPDSNNFKTIKKFSEFNSIEVRKTLSLLELLRNENLIEVNKIYDTVEGDENTPESTSFKDLTIEKFNVDPSKVKSVYESVKTIFETHICSGCGLCVGICPVNCLEVYNGFGKIDEDKCIKCGLCYFVCPRSYLPVSVLNMTQDKSSEIFTHHNPGPRYSPNERMRGDACALWIVNRTFPAVVSGKRSSFLCPMVVPSAIVFHPCPSHASRE